MLKSVGAHPVVRCVSPVGRFAADEDHDVIAASAHHEPMKIGSIRTPDEQTYDLTIEGEVLLSQSGEFDAQRVARLIRRVVSQADALEQEHFPGIDAKLEAFRQDNEQEAVDGR